MPVCGLNLVTEITLDFLEILLPATIVKNKPDAENLEKISEGTCCTLCANVVLVSFCRMLDFFCFFEEKH